MYDERKGAQLDNELRWRQKQMQDNTNDAGFADWRMAKSFENLLSTLSGVKGDTEFVAKLHEWVDEQAKYLAGHIAEREKIRAEINDIQKQIAENI